MAVPKKKQTRMKRGHRRAHQKLVAPQTIQCPNCKGATMPHRVCPACGHYKGKEIVRSDEL
ncbi:MAG: 50S ribosomal protein L32 [Deltaproteobacteria bacterium RIFCSPHIGHO2_02_FULL_40_11]|nr:MAG: 50S ribosomal protein L32 [Deltaproteobacteria bacterium RIFCSPHIGHO2_02_FULL_40_11]